MQIQFCFSCNHLGYVPGNLSKQCKKFSKVLTVGTNGFITGLQRCDECAKETANHFAKYEEKK